MLGWYCVEKFSVIVTNWIYHCFGYTSRPVSGQCLDSWLGFIYILTLVFTFMGVISGFMNTYRLIIRMNKSKTHEIWIHKLQMIYRVIKKFLQIM